MKRFISLVLIILKISPLGKPKTKEIYWLMNKNLESIRCKSNRSYSLCNSLGYVLIFCVKLEKSPIHYMKLVFWYFPELYFQKPFFSKNGLFWYNRYEFYKRKAALQKAMKLL